MSSSQKVETKGKTSDAVKILDSMIGDEPEAKKLLEEARVNAAVSLLVYEARTKARLSQAELAEKIGTTQSVISRLEDADYDGHSLSMLHRIAGALNKKLEVRFVPDKAAARKRAA
jgi:ribosome-binding protein aMBF1 (putative translation factor)